MKKVLIFYSNTGGGHRAVAKALATALEEKNLSVSVKEGLDQGLFLKADPNLVFIVLSQYFEGVYNFFYKTTDNKIGVRILRNLAKTIWGRKLRKVINQEKPDVIISTHPLISPTAVNLAISPLFLMINTNLGKTHRIEFDPKASMTIVQDQEAKLHGENIVKNDVHYFGPIIRPEFLKETPHPQLSQKILVLGGGGGTGNIEKNVEALVAHLPDNKIVAVCGLNDSLRKKLENLNAKNLEVFGFVEDMASLMTSVDIVVTKAGPNTILEAASLGKPLIITSWVGIQEKTNIDLVVKSNLGIYSPDSKKLPSAVKEIYDSYTKYSNSKKYPNSTSKIAEFIISKL